MGNRIFLGLEYLKFNQELNGIKKRRRKIPVWTTNAEFVILHYFNSFKKMSTYIGLARPLTELAILTLNSADWTLQLGPRTRCLEQL